MNLRRRPPMREYVPSSSRSISAEKPATSAARIAAKRRSIRSCIVREHIFQAGRSISCVLRAIAFISLSKTPSTSLNGRAVKFSRLQAGFRNALPIPAIIVVPLLNWGDVAGRDVHPK